MKTKIYIIRNEFSVVKYVGKTTRSLNIRLRDHINEALRGGTTHKCNGIRRMITLGLQPALELLFEVDGNGNQEEIEQISKFRCLGIVLWNGTDGGDGVTMTKEMRLKISKSRKGYKCTEEAIRKNREGHMGQPGFWKGKHLPEAAKTKMSKAKKGFVPWIAGKTHSLGSRRKMSKHLKGKVAWNKGLRKENVCKETLRTRKYYDREYNTKRVKLDVEKYTERKT